MRSELFLTVKIVEIAVKSQDKLININLSRECLFKSLQAMKADISATKTWDKCYF